MVDLDCKTKMVSPEMPKKSPKLSDKLTVSIPAKFRNGERSPFPAPAPAVAAYEHYLRLPELRKLWACREFPSWQNEPILRPALHALELTFRFVSTVLSDPRPYANRREWGRRLETLATGQIELVAILCESEEEDDRTRGAAPLADSSSPTGVLSRDDSAAEVWKLSGETTVVSRPSEVSLLPRLAAWPRSEDVAQKILYSIECEMRRCPYTLGLGEPNLSGKPSLQYDAVCKPAELHSLKKSPSEQMSIENRENQTLYTTHQILECWIQAARGLLARVGESIGEGSFEKASGDCWLVERIWKLLAEIEDAHLLMDPDDFLRLKNELAIKSTSESEPFCFRSQGLIEIAKLSKDLKHKVPTVLGVEVDPKGGPRIQEAAMDLYREKRGFEKIHLLQAMQGIEAAMKRFFFAYRQVVVVVMGSLEAKGSRALLSCGGGGGAERAGGDALAQIFLEPTYFPSLDAAKTFLGDFWEREKQGKRFNSERRTRCGSGQ